MRPNNNDRPQDQSEKATAAVGSLQQQVTVMQAGTQSGKPQGKLPVQVIFTRLHTGSIGGWTLRILYFLAALIGACLPWSGYYMWYKRTHPKKN